MDGLAALLGCLAALLDVLAALMDALAVTLGTILEKLTLINDNFSENFVYTLLVASSHEVPL
jgi:hypothetical protein